MVNKPVEGALFLAALVASCFLGALPPVDFLAVCFVLAMSACELFQFQFLCDLNLERYRSLYNKCDSGLIQLLSWVDWLIVTQVSIRYTGTCQACEMYLPGVTIYLTDNSSNFSLIFVLYPQVKPVFSGSIWSFRDWTLKIKMMLLIF